MTKKYPLFWANSGWGFLREEFLPFFPQAALEPEQGFGRGVGCQQVDTEQNRRIAAGKCGQIKPTHQALDDDMMGQNTA